MFPLNALKVGDRVRAVETVRWGAKVKGKRWPVRQKMPAGAAGTVVKVYPLPEDTSPWQNQVVVMFDGGGPGSTRTVMFSRLQKDRRGVPIEVIP